MNKYATEIGLQEKMDNFYKGSGFDGPRINKHATMDVGRSADILAGLRYIRPVFLSMKVKIPLQ